jgi:hypothetical protein
MNMNNTTNTPNSRQPLGLRILRGLAVVGLWLGLTLISTLVIVGCLPVLFTELGQSFASSNKVLRVAFIFTVIFSNFLPLIVILVAEGRRWLTWSVIAGAWIAILPVLVWLSWDEPALRRPITFEEFSPTVPGDEKSYELLMQYSKQTPSAEAKAFLQGKLYAMGWKHSASTREPAQWLGFVTENRAALEADWAALAPQRHWLEELAAFDRIGDFTPADASANVMTYQVWSTLSHRTCAMATLLALDGQGDRAIEYLTPLLEVGRKLQLSSRMPSRSMVGIVVERMALETAGIVLEQAPVSAASRARMAAAITNDDASALARRMILVDYVQTLPKFTRMKLGDEVTSDHGVSRLLRRPLNWLGAHFVNPVATANLYGDHIYALADLAEQRKLVEFSQCGEDFINMIWGRVGVKNTGGRMMLNLAIPAMGKALDNHWKTADIRAELRLKLAR